MKFESMKKQKVKKVLAGVTRFLLNPHFLLCFGIAWVITNGWSYALFLLGSYFQVGWMVTIATAYLAFLWLPISPEKIVTIGIAMGLLRVLFPEDQKTLGVLQKLHEKAKRKKRKPLNEAWLSESQSLEDQSA